MILKKKYLQGQAQSGWELLWEQRTKAHPASCCGFMLFQALSSYLFRKKA